MYLVITNVTDQPKPHEEYIEIQQEYTITNNGTTELTLEWDEPLPSGEYNLYVCLQDIFNGKNVHPLIVDFNRIQDYDILFSIP